MLYKQIILEWGQDTESGVWGLGYSPDNGKNFYVLNTTHGRKYRAEDGNRLYPYISDQVQDKIDTAVTPAKSAADSAYSMASQAVEQANVTKQAQAATDQAITEAKQGANDAMSRAMSAWDVATGAKEAVTDFDPLIKSAQSDASKALAQIADTANALSDAKTAFGSGVAEAKELAITAQTTANSAVESAGENAKELASQANALSDAKKAIDSDVASAKGLANAAQSTADNAIKSASSVADDLTAVASQAKANANGITKVTSDVGLLQTTVANNTGDISTIQETATQIQQAVSDNSGAIVVAKQTADSAVTVASDAKSNATVAVQTASGASVTAKNAQGYATTAMTTANSAVIQASDAKSNATVAVQTASEASLTAANAKGDASIAKQTASDASVQIKNAQGDISKLQTRAGTIEASVTNNSGAIADVQATANQLKASVSDNAGNITVAKQTADSAVAVASDAKSNATVAIQTASQASITAQNASGQAASAVLTANGAMTTASDAKSDATVAIQTASGASLTATNAQGDASIAKQTASEAKVQASNAESDFAQLSVRANKIETNVANNSGAIANVQQTANGLTTTVADIKANGGGVNLLTGTSGDLQTKQFTNSWNVGPQATNGNYKIKLVKGQTYTYRAWLDNANTNANSSDHVFVNVRFTPIGGTNFNLGNGTFIEKGETGYSTLVFTPSEDGYANFVPFAYGTPQTFLAGWKEEMLEEGTVAHTWSPAPADLQTQFTQIKTSIDGIATTINDPKTGLNATYQTAAGNATTISNVKSDVYQLEMTASGLTSRVGNLESKTNTQETATEQNKNAIKLKADQADVDKINGTVSQLQSTLTVQAGQIQEKVTSSQVTGMLSGYATQDYTQSLVTQKANDWNLNLTNLKTDVDAIKANGGGVNLLTGTSKDELSGKAYLFHDYQISGGLQPGTTYTLSGLARVDQTAMDNQQHIFVYAYTSNWSWGGVLNIDGSLTAKYNTATFTTPSGEQQFNPTVSVYLSHPNGDGSKDSISGTGYISKLMLEKGTVAHDWQPSPSDMATVTSVTNLSVTVDGIKSTVATKADQSTITQLSNVIATKVSSSDFNNLSQSVNLQTLDSADINNMRTNGHYFVHNLANNPIGGWVYVDVVGNGNDRIRQDVYQDQDNQHCYRRWNGSVWTSWSKGATESEITQLSDAINLRVSKGDVISQINEEAGGNTLIQVSNGKGSLILNADNTIITGKAWIPDAAISSISADKIMLGSSALYNSDGTLNLVNIKDGTTSKIIATQGNVDFDGTEKNASVIHFASDNNTNAFTITPVGATVTPTLFFERFDQTPGHWLGFTRNETEHEGVMFHTWDDDGERFFVDCHARFNKNLRTIGTLSQGSWDGTTAKPEAGILTIKSGNTIWSGSDFLAVGSNVTGTYTGVWAKAFVQQSTLSAKTNIETVDPKYALDLVNKTDIRSYQYKSDVAQGYNKRYTSLIIDDVNDVSKYYAPNEFTNEERTGRDDGSAVGYLFLAVKELTRRIKTLEEKLNG